MRKPAQKRKPRIAKLATFPAPVSGWIRNENLASPNVRKPDGSKVFGAHTLENWFPTATGARMRGGSDVHGTLGDGSLDVQSLFSYMNGNNQSLFGATETDIYDVTLGGTPSAAVSSLGSGNWSVVQFATSGGTYLRAVNGVDTPLVYDGSTWGTTPAITGPTPTTLANVWQWKERLFFLQVDTLDAYYLGAGEVGGAATKLPLGGVFGRGGSLVFGASWSLDENSGLSASCIFATSEGEVAVFQGSDPGDATKWSLNGVYQIGKPRGQKAFIRAGGDLVIATDIGFVPLSQAIQRDIAALAPAAVSYPIETAWNEIVAGRSFADWHCEIWPTKQMVLIALPAQAGDAPIMLAANARTGAWGLFTGWQGTCLERFGDRLFFGSTSGKVIEAEVTGADQDLPYTATCIPLFDQLKTPASIKTSLLGRVVLRAAQEVEAKLSLQKDYVIDLPTVPDDITSADGSLWGTAKWGEDVWATVAELLTFRKWRSLPGSGIALSPAVQITSGGVARPNVELVQIDMTYDVGDIVT